VWISSKTQKQESVMLKTDKDTLVLVVQTVPFSFFLLIKVGGNMYLVAEAMSKDLIHFFLFQAYFVLHSLEFCFFKKQ